LRHPYQHHLDQPQLEQELVLPQVLPRVLLLELPQVPHLALLFAFLQE
jgi:hypothetical protein